MTAVLLASNRPGSSSWVAARDSREVRVSGMKSGDALAIHFRGKNGMRASEMVVGNCTVLIPEGTVFVCVDHLKVSGSRVSVDLER